ncbi:MAG: signal peptidase II [Anaerolineae bacterium]|nr:signal peptidase II [Anaerolineae bacterium]NUQ06705.1 signal peptidase II [Anaerolineae bacterium]
MNPTTRKWLRLIAALFLLLLIDQASKRWVIAALPYERTVQPIPALAPFFQFTYIHNTGAAFGFLPQAGDFFLIIAVVVSIGVLYSYPRVPADAALTQIALGMVLAGALGNALDRLTIGAVVDFIHYQIPGVVSNVSNLADHAIVGGTIILFLKSWRAPDHRPQDAAKAGDETPPGRV